MVFGPATIRQLSLFYSLDNVGARDHVGKLLKGELAVAVLVGLHDGLVDNLLQLLVLGSVSLGLLRHKASWTEGIGCLAGKPHAPAQQERFRQVVPSCSG